MKLTRRTAIRRAMLLASGIIMSQMTLVKAQGARLLVPLDQWGAVVFQHKGKSITIPVAEIFEALKDSE